MSGRATGRKLIEEYQGGWVSSQYGPFNFYGHLGGQTGETARLGHFWAKSMCYSHNFEGRPKV